MVCYLNEAKLKAGREVSHSQQSIRSQVETRKGPFIDGTQVFLYLDQEHQYWRASKHKIFNMHIANDLKR